LPDRQFVKHGAATFMGEVHLGNRGRSAGTACAHVSVIIPTSDAYRDGYFPRLLKQLKQQTFQDFEVIIVKGDPRQGRAINTGAALARGEILITLDDDTRLGHPEVFENLVAVLRKHPGIGMAGVANIVPGRAPWLVRRVMQEVPRRSSDMVSEITESDMAEHPCCAIPRRVFFEVGGENEIIPRGLDPYLRAEIRKAGYRVVVIPDTFIHHLPPAGFRKLMRQFFRNGRQSAFCSRHYPQWVIELTEEHGDAVPGKRSLPRRATDAGLRLAKAIFTGKVILLLTLLAYQAGFAWEWMAPAQKPAERTRSDQPDLFGPAPGR
jgi:hypothetical protein